MSGPFHSEMEAPGGNTIGNMALLPLRQTVKNAGRGFAPETQDEDIVDEVFVDVDNADDDGDNIHTSALSTHLAFDSCVSES